MCAQIKQENHHQRHQYERHQYERHEFSSANEHEGNEDDDSDMPACAVSAIIPQDQFKNEYHRQGHNSHIETRLT